MSAANPFEGPKAKAAPERAIETLADHPLIRDPNRLWCPGCLAFDSLKKSPMSAAMCAEDGVLPICCSVCILHVWAPLPLKAASR
jgi:hypothetical protein